MLSSPVVSDTPAWNPMPMFLVPVLFLRALAPMAMFSLPATLFARARNRAAVLRLPVPLAKRASVPYAVWLLRRVWVRSASAPRAARPLAVMPSKSAFVPLAVFEDPVVLPRSAFCPKALFASPVALDSADAPNAVLAAPLFMFRLAASALVPPAVLLLLSLTVGLTPWLMQGAAFSSMINPAAIVTRRTVELLIKASMCTGRSG